MVNKKIRRNARKTFIDILNEVKPETFDRITITGRKFRENVKLSKIAEPNAIEYALDYLDLDTEKYNIVRVGITEEAARGATLAVTRGNTTTTYDLDAYTAKGGVITFTLENITATDLGEDITFTLKSGTTVTGTLTMSANAYLYRIQQANTSTALTTLARAIYAYGKAADSYAK